MSSIVDDVLFLHLRILRHLETWVTANARPKFTLPVGESLQVAIYMASNLLPRPRTPGS